MPTGRLPNTIRQSVSSKAGARIKGTLHSLLVTILLQCVFMAGYINNKDKNIILPDKITHVTLESESGKYFRLKFEATASAWSMRNRGISLQLDHTSTVWQKRLS